MKIIIDNFDFWNMEAMKYWSHPKSVSTEKKREESRFMCLSGNYIGARKMDGAWNMIIRDMEGNFHMRSRTAGVNGGFVDKAEWIPQICNELTNIPNGSVLIGEIYFPDNEGSRKITSVLNCLKDKCLERQRRNGYLHFYNFDVIAWDGRSLLNCPIEDRIKFIDAAINEKSNYIHRAFYYSGDKLWDLYGKTIEAGGEGIVISRKDCTYMPGKRTARMTLKMKKEINQTIDVFLSGKYKPATKDYDGQSIETWSYWMNDKTGEKTNVCMFDEYCDGQPWIPITKFYYYGWAGSVEFCVLKDDNVIHVGWISGITDEMRKGIVENPEEYIHKVFEITAMEIEHINGEYTLRHGKIVQERTDKIWSQCDFSQIA